MFRFIIYNLIVFTNLLPKFHTKQTFRISDLKCVEDEFSLLGMNIFLIFLPTIFIISVFEANTFGSDGSLSMKGVGKHQKYFSERDLKVIYNQQEPKTRHLPQTGSSKVILLYFTKTLTVQVFMNFVYKFISYMFSF